MPTDKKDIFSGTSAWFGDMEGITGSNENCFHMADAVDAGIQIHVCASPVAIVRQQCIAACGRPFPILSWSMNTHVTNRSEKYNIRLVFIDWSAGYCGLRHVPELPGIWSELSSVSHDYALQKGDSERGIRICKSESEKWTLKRQRLIVWGPLQFVWR